MSDPMSESMRERALEVVEVALYGCKQAVSQGMHSQQAVDALLAAGLLATPALVECGEAAILRSRFPDVFPRGSYPEAAQATARVKQAGSALLAEREAARPKPRYKLIQNSRGKMAVVLDTHEGNSIYAPGGGFTESQARCVADALNALEGGAK